MLANPVRAAERPQARQRFPLPAEAFAPPAQGSVRALAQGGRRFRKAGSNETLLPITPQHYTCALACKSRLNLILPDRCFFDKRPAGTGSRRLPECKYAGRGGKVPRPAGCFVQPSPLLVVKIAAAIGVACKPRDRDERGIRIRILIGRVQRRQPNILAVGLGLEAGVARVSVQVVLARECALRAPVYGNLIAVAGYLSGLGRRGDCNNHCGDSKFPEGQHEMLLV